MVNKLKSYNQKINKFLAKLNFSQDNSLLILGGITGLLGGLGAIIFHEAIHFIENLFFKQNAKFFNLNSLLEGNTWEIYAILIAIPAIGGILVGLLSYFFEKGEEGEGIPNVIDAVASKGGVINGYIAIKKTIGAALSIGTGGAGGKEGPIVQIGASIASAFGRLFHLSQDRLRILVGCGAAAGLSAAFNAPLGGALFAMEIILRTFNAKTFSPIIVASVFATALSRGYLGDEPAFSLTKYELISNYEFIFYIILGLLCGLGAIYFVKVFYLIEDFWEKVKVSKIFKPAIGGLIVGVIGLFLPGVYGFSYQAVNDALRGDISILLLVGLLFIKPIATAMTIGSGGNGGTFAPSIFTGAMLGGLFGQILQLVFPELSIEAGSYALVGMAAVVAGTTHASLTAVIMVFEMTNDYKIILPLMLTIIIATTVSRAVLGGDLYSLNFIRRGKEIDIYGRKISILKKIKIESLIEKNYDCLHDYDTFQTILAAIKKSKYNMLLVKSKDDKLVGQISFQDIRDTIIDDDARSITNFLIVRDVMTEDIIDLNWRINGEDAMKIFETTEYEFLPVVDNEKNLIGIISKTALLNKYQKEVFIQQSDSEMDL